MSPSGNRGPIGVPRNLDRPRHIPLENPDALLIQSSRGDSGTGPPLPAGAGSWVYQNFPPFESSCRDPSGRVTRTAASGKAASSRPARSGGVT